MSFRIPIVVSALFAGLVLPGPAPAANCAQVNKYLGTGRSVQDVAETMILPEAEVQKCKDEAKGGGTASPTPAAGGEAKK